MNQRILGIDPGYGRCGYAILDTHARPPKLLSFGVITTTPKDYFPFRLDEIAQDYLYLIEKYKPTILSIEGLFLKDNKTTGMKVSQVRGVLIYLAHQNGMRVVEGNPIQIKSSFSGNGKATKAEMRIMANMKYPETKTKTIDDAIDAIAVAEFARNLR